MALLALFTLFVSFLTLSTANFNTSDIYTNPILPTGADPWVASSTQSRRYTRSLSLISV